MNDQLHTDAEELVNEAARYLEIVDVFRALDCEPRWRPDAGPPAEEHEGAQRTARIEASAH